MRFAEFLMPSLPDNFGIVNHNTSDQGIRTNATSAEFSQFKRSAHKKLIDVVIVFYH
jgi:hypothetical protein